MLPPAANANFSSARDEYTGQEESQSPFGTGTLDANSTKGLGFADTSRSDISRQRTSSSRNSGS